MRISGNRKLRLAPRRYQFDSANANRCGIRGLYPALGRMAVQAQVGSAEPRCGLCAEAPLEWAAPETTAELPARSRLRPIRCRQHARGGIHGWSVPGRAAGVSEVRCCFRCSMARFKAPPGCEDRLRCHLQNGNVPRMCGSPPRGVPVQN